MRYSLLQIPEIPESEIPLADARFQPSWKAFIPVPATIITCLPAEEVRHIQATIGPTAMARAVLRRIYWARPCHILSVRSARYPEAVLRLASTTQSSHTTPVQTCFQLGHQVQGATATYSAALHKMSQYGPLWLFHDGPLPYGKTHKLVN